VKCDGIVAAAVQTDLQAKCVFNVPIFLGVFRGWSVVVEVSRVEQVEPAVFDI